MTGNNGVVPQSWFPTGTEKDFKLGASMAPLEPLKANLIILDGPRRMQRGTTDGTAHGRGAASAVSGWIVQRQERHPRRRLDGSGAWPTPSAAARGSSR